jgi:hypothetical protein
VLGGWAVEPVTQREHAGFVEVADHG